MNKEERDKISDLRELEIMWNSIVDCENGTMDIQICLTQIGKAAERIAYNDRNDKESRYFRNKYGFIQRNKNRAINEDGIYFEVFANYAGLYKPRGYRFITEKETLNESFDILSQLSNLKRKVAHIFQEEDPSINHLSEEIVADFTASIRPLTTCLMLDNTLWILCEVKSEVEVVEPIDFNERDDRYYSARLFVMIGEAINDLDGYFRRAPIDQSLTFEFLDKAKNVIKTDSDSTDFKLKMGLENPNFQYVSMAFKNLREMRDFMCHKIHKTISNGTSDKNEAINTIIKDVIIHLENVIIKDSSGFYILDDRYENMNKFETDTKKLVDVFSGKENKDNIPKMPHDKSEKKTVKPLETVSTEHSSNNLNKLITKASEIFPKTNISLAEDSMRKLRGMDAQYQKYLKNLTVSDQINYPSSLNIENKAEIIKKSKKIGNSLNPVIKSTLSSTKVSDVSDKSNKILVKGEAIQEEVMYLRFFVQKDYDQPASRKSNFILKHILMLICQFVRDIDDVKGCDGQDDTPTNSQEPQLLSAILNKLSTDLIITEVKKVLKSLRVNGLAHKIFSFDKPNFAKSIDNLLSYFSCAETQLYSYLNILRAETPNPSYLSLYEKGYSFYNIGSLDQAVEYLDKAIKMVEDQKKEDNFSCPDSSDVYVQISGFPKCVFKVYFTLIVSLYTNKQFERAKEEIEKLLYQISEQKVIACENIDLKQVVNGLYSMLFRCYLMEENKAKCREVFCKVEKISDDSETKYALAETDVYLEAYEKCEEFCEIILQHDSIDEYYFNFRAFFVHIYLKKGSDEISKARHCIDRMNEVFENEIQQFKHILGDSYLLIKLIIISKELDLFIKECTAGVNKNISFDERLRKLKKIETEFTEIHNKIGKDEISNHQSTIFCMLLCSAYCCVYDQIQIHSSNDKEYLDSATTYFNLATENIRQNPDWDNTIKVNLETIGSNLSEVDRHFAMGSLSH